MADKVKDQIVWSRFEAKSRDGRSMGLRIQNVPEDKKEEAINMFIDLSFQEEAVMEACVRPYRDDEEAMKIILEGWREYLRYKTILICCPDASADVDEVFGVSIGVLYERGKEEKWDDLDEYPESVQNFATKVMKVLEKFDAFQHFSDITSYYEDIGIVVKPQYRGLGIASHFLICRLLEAKALRADMAGAWMTAQATQKAALRDGWQLAAELRYKDLEDEFGIKFLEGLPESIKVMVKRTN